MTKGNDWYIMYGEITSQLEGQVEENNKLQEDINRRQERYIKREEEYRKHINELQRELRVRYGFENNAEEKNKIKI